VSLDLGITSKVWIESIRELTPTPMDLTRNGTVPSTPEHISLGSTTVREQASLASCSLTSSNMEKSTGVAPRYQANLTGGSLKVAESRIVAGLLLKGGDPREWRTAIQTENLLKTRSPGTAKRLGRLIRDRLAPMPPEILQLIRDGAGDVATHAVLAAAIRHSPLLGDFMDLALRDQYRRFSNCLTYKVWEDYLEECRGRDPDMPEWSDSTVRRLRSSIFQILAQAGFIQNTRSLALHRPQIADQVIACLKLNREDYVLRCITVGS
jgi:hypothetical protein